MRFRLATRGSTLAMIQVELAAAALTRRFPEHEFVPAPMTTHGDRHPSMPLTEASREGVFVKELERAILDGRAELAVHSAKDLPTEPSPPLVIAAFLPRADARDVLVAREPATLASLPPRARVGTGSPRRAAQILALRPDLQTLPVRGNVDTRLRRLREGVVDVLILAAAGLERLGRSNEAHELLPFDVMLPAPGQGALAIQAIEGSEAARLAAQIDDRATSRAVNAERDVLRRLGGGCLSAVGAYAEVLGRELDLRAVVLAEDGTRVLRARATGADDGEVVRRVVAALDQQGSARLVRPASIGPLAGLRVMVTRATRQAPPLTRSLEEEGATVVECPVIVIEPIDVDASRLQNLDAYDWLVLTSANGVDRLLELLVAAGIGFPTHIKVAAIGPETAARLRDHGALAAIVPDRYIAEELADELAAAVQPGARILLARAAGARDVLPIRLREHGARVDVIETYRAAAPAELRRSLAERLPRVDLVTFTSSSTVRNFVEALDGAPLDSIAVACIGPVTAQTATDFGLRVDIIAQEYTTRGLVDAIVRSRAPISA